MSEKGRISPIFVKIILVLGVVIFVFVAIAIYKETSKKNQIQSEIQKLKDEAEKIGKDNSNIQEKIAYFQSQDYMEKEAKDKLNLKSPDEQVVVVKPTIMKEAQAPEQKDPVAPPQVVVVANHLKWWNYFFKY